MSEDERGVRMRDKCCRDQGSECMLTFAMKLSYELHSAVCGRKYFRLL